MNHSMAEASNATNVITINIAAPYAADSRAGCAMFDFKILANCNFLLPLPGHTFEQGIGAI
ncbi:MAG TPA: hypothetical protein VGM52_14015 [Herbaspirillum sp.]|jgi:hypothetical protein